MNVAETFTFPLNLDEEDHDHGMDHDHNGHSHANGKGQINGPDPNEEKNDIQLQKEEERKENLKKIQDVLKKAEKILGEKPLALNDIAELDTCVTLVDCKAFSGDITSAESLVERYQNVDEEDEGTISTLLIQQIEFAKYYLISYLISYSNYYFIMISYLIYNDFLLTCYFTYYV